MQRKKLACLAAASGAVGLALAAEASAADSAAATLQAVSEGRCKPTSIPAVAMVFELDGCVIDVDPVSCGEVVPLADGFFLYTGSYVVPDLGRVSWSLRVDPDPFVIANFVVTNNTSDSQSYTIQVQLPTALAGPTVIGGSVSGTFSDGNRNGAELAAPSGGSIYTALVDGIPVPAGILLADPTLFTAPQFDTATVGPASFGDPIPSLAFGAVAASIGINLTFSLTAGDHASLTSIFVVE